MSKFSFQHSDAWIYLCIPKKPPGSTKEEILSSADHINQAIPTDEEFDGAIERGLASELIETQNKKYYFSTKYGATIQSLVESQKDIFKAWEALEQFLKNFDV